MPRYLLEGVRVSDDLDTHEEEELFDAIEAPWKNGQLDRFLPTEHDRAGCSAILEIDEKQADTWDDYVIALALNDILYPRDNEGPAESDPELEEEEEN